MATITFRGELKIHVAGNLPEIGSKAPAFTLVKSDLSEISLQDLAGKTVILNIFPSLDTSTCAASVRRFNKEAASLPNVAILAVSADLPFAAGRFCTVEGIDKVSTGSVFRNPEFAKNYGVLMTDGPLKGLLARSIVVIDPKGKVTYTELVGEVTEEPDYQEAHKAATSV
ncbi:putative thiol peroxidase [Bacteroidia bacterium]|nr:putative thiol peroxidase [Bacteroidia bacterium]GHT60886.1 putative thiol peroxidase [Bacteroidia bacterium]